MTLKPSREAQRRRRGFYYIIPYFILPLALHIVNLLSYMPRPITRLICWAIGYALFAANWVIKHL